MGYVTGKNKLWKAPLEKLIYYNQSLKTASSQENALRANELETLSRLLLDLYGDAASAGGTAFQSRALERLALDLAFSGAAWAYGVMTPSGVIVHDILVSGLSQGFAEAVRATAAIDPTSHKLAAASGRSFIHSRADYPEEMLRLAADPDDLSSSVEGMIIDPPTGLFGSVCLFRNGKLPPFKEAERRLHESLLPHWIQAMSSKLIDEAFARSSGRTSAAAVTRSDGALEAANAAFVALLREEWPDWPGGIIPTALLARNGSVPGGKYAGTHIVAHTTRLPPRVLVQLRPRRPLDSLGKRELEVAELLNEGLSLKEVARKLAVSHSTAKNHRDNIYRKLGVSNRVGVLKAIRESDRQ